MSNEPLSREFYDQVTTDPAGYRDKRGEWRPAEPVRYAPIFVWPNNLTKFLLWLKDYLFGWNLFFLAVTLVTWQWFQPPLETCRTFQPGWIGYLFIRNLILLWIIYGGWHLYLYTFKGRGFRGKYAPRWQSKGGATFIFKNQVFDNIFWACGSGCLTWTAYEVLTFWMYANGHLPYLDFKTSPALFIGLFLLIPFWREFHFYWIHRLIHWKPLYDKIHYLHHYNINPGPWSGMAMHPVEHLLYFSVTLIHWIIPSHPLHFLFNAQHTALTPAAGHSGFEGELTEQISFGSYFHYLHHRHFDCNYGEASIPLDKWFGSFNDGSRTDSEKSEARRTFRSYVVERVVEESPEVKSFHLKRADGKPTDPFAPGQHLMFKVPAAGNGRSALRFYSFSDAPREDGYRISVKREAAPANAPGAPAGVVSGYLHDQVKPGDVLEARGPLGDFTPDVSSRKPLALIAGGIGITPILCMAKTCLQQHPRRPIHLLLAFREPRLQVFRKEAEELARHYPNFRCRVFFEQDGEGAAVDQPGSVIGRITPDRLKLELPHLKMDFYICGPAAMMTALVEGLKAEGVPADRLHTENFNQGAVQGAATSVTEEQHEVTFARSGKTLRWDAEFRNLLEFAESNGITMEAGCMFGECGACSVRLKEGEVDYNYTTAMKPREQHCLPCSCRPRGPLVLDA